MNVGLSLRLRLLETIDTNLLHADDVTMNATGKDSPVQESSDWLSHVFQNHIILETILSYLTGRDFWTLSLSHGDISRTAEGVSN